MSEQLADIAPGGNSTSAFDVEKVREDFPILQQEVYGKPLVYLDNAASAQKPVQVLDAMDEAYRTYYANVHRGIHRLSQIATDHYEEARGKAARFVNATNEDEIVFTRGATEAINLVASCFGETFLQPGDEVLISEMEHHSNIVPWQLLAARRGVKVRAIPIDDAGNLDLEAYGELLGPKVKLVAITHISNALGSVVPIKKVAKMAHDAGARILVDGCQAAPHMAIDVRDLDADFYCFSSHKIYGPTGMGVLYGKMELLEALPPYQGGGEMISEVTLEGSTFKEPPHRFEAGTPPIVEAIGMGAAMDYIAALGFENIHAQEDGLLAYATDRMKRIPGLRIIGEADEKASIISFIMEDCHAHDAGTILDRKGVAVRAGHHCAQPVMERFGIAATARASFGLYNTRAEVDALVEALETVREMFG